MKLLEWDALIDNGFGKTAEFKTVRTDIVNAIDLIRWPTNSDTFAIYPESGKKRGGGNGVGPIKDAFVLHLHERGWAPERRRRGPESFDATYNFPGQEKPFAVEWETGNISSSHRSINRMALGMLQERISGGVIVVPSRALYKYLTDRIGNAQELEPYHDLWRLWGRDPKFGYLAIVTVEHDLVSTEVARIRKGTDGRALA